MSITFTKGGTVECSDKHREAFARQVEIFKEGEGMSDEEREILGLQDHMLAEALRSQFEMFQFTVREANRRNLKVVVRQGTDSGEHIWDIKRFASEGAQIRIRRDEEL